MAEIVKIFKKQKVSKVLDLGFGTGRHTVYLAKRGFEVYGIDISKHGHKLTRQWLKKENVNAKLKIGNVYKKLSYSDDFFDAVISVLVIHHARIEDIRKAIKEIERVSKNNGGLFITVPKGINKLKKKKKFIAERTFVPLGEWEKGLPHYQFNKDLLKKEFKNFQPQIWVERAPSINYKGTYRPHYVLLGRLKK